MENYVKLLAVLHILVAGLMALLGFVVLLWSGMISPIDFPRATVTMPATSDLSTEAHLLQVALGLAGSFVLLLALASFITGVGLFQFRRWAWMLGIGLSIFELILVPLGTLFGIYSLCVLLPKATRRLFSPMASCTPET